jgi:putative Holliday junction resolvase
MPSKPMMTIFGPVTTARGAPLQAIAAATAAAESTRPKMPGRHAPEIVLMVSARSITPGDVGFLVRVLGIDYGAKRIGLALSDPTAMLASPWQTVPGGPPIPAAARLVPVIADLVADDDGLEAIVVGLPRRLDGSDNDQTPLARAFAAELARASSLPVILQDERLSSREAESRLALRERDWRKRKAKLDAVAAAVILQDYLDHR